MVLFVEVLFALSSIIFIFTALVIAEQALQSYIQTSPGSMVYLSVGLSIAVAGAAATLISAFLTDFADARLLLLVNSVFFTIGFLLVMYSLIVYE
jgi:hypothetical protein